MNLPRLGEPQLSRVLIGLARNPGASADVRSRLMARPPAAAEIARRTDGSITEEVVNRLMALNDRSVVYSLACNRALPTTVRQNLAEHADSSVREFLARFSSPPTEVLQKLAADPEPRVREAVAENRDTPPHIRELLLDDPDREVRRVLAQCWAQTPEPALRRLLTDPDPTVRNAAAYPWRRWGPAPVPPQDMHKTLLADPATRGCALTHVPLSAQLAAELANDSDEETLRFLAAHPDLPADVRDRLAECTEPLVRAELAARRDIPEELRVRLLDGLREQALTAQDAEGWMAGFALGSLQNRTPITWLHTAPLDERLAYLDSPHIFLRLTVAMSDGLPRYAIDRLLGDPDPGVRLNMAMRLPDLDADTLEHLERRHVPRAGRMGSPADHPNFPSDALRRFATDPDARLRELSCRDPELPAALTAELATDPEPLVRLAVADHPNLPEDYLAALLADDNLDVVETAASSPAMPLTWMNDLLTQADL